MTLEDLRSIDRSGMYELLRTFPGQAREAVAIGAASRIRINPRPITSIVLTGLGGSAIGGDLLRSYLAGELRVPFLVNRHYRLPHFVGPRTLVIVSSYSGNTEETIAAHREALRRKAKILCITSGGATLRMARHSKSPCVVIPPGRPPRTALAYSFFPLLEILTRSGFAHSKEAEVRETIALLERLAGVYANPDETANRAMSLAALLRGELGVVYSSTEHFDAVGTRWRGQISENAKALFFGNVLPEMNHNELVGWRVLTRLMSEMRVFLLRDRGDHRRVQMRMEITKEILSACCPHVTEVWSEGKSLLARMFSLICLGDWVSYYLAILHGVDPTPVEVITRLKEELARQ